MIMWACIVAFFALLWLVSRFLDRRRTKLGYYRDNISASERAHVAEEQHASVRMPMPPPPFGGGIQ